MRCQAQVGYHRVPPACAGHRAEGVHLLRPSAGFLIATVIALPGHIGRSGRDDVTQRIAAFEKAFRPTQQEPRTPEQRKQAVAELAGLDAPAVAAAVARAWELCANDMARIVEERQRIVARIAALIEGQEFGERTLPVERMDEFNALKGRSRALGEEEEGLREVEAALGRALERMQSEASHEWLVDNVIGAEELPLSLRLSVAQHAGQFGEKLAARLGKLLVRAKAAEEVAVLLAGVGACGKTAQSCTPAVIPYLGHADANVREQAAAA